MDTVVVAAAAAAAVVDWLDQSLNQTPWTN